MKTKSEKPVSLRINSETRAQLDYLTERTGLRQAQVIRVAIKLLEEKERSQAAAVSKPARKMR